MATTGKAILEKLLDRLYASLLQGPCLNCRPHSSRQRLDLTELQALKHLPPSALLPALLGEGGKAEVHAKVPAWKGPEEEEGLTEGQRLARGAADRQTRLMEKLRDLAEDAADYEQETGENALYLGYPLLSVPPGAETFGVPNSRILAPVTLIPVTLTVKRGTSQSISLAAKGAGMDLVMANFPLLAWLEQQTGLDTSNLFADEEGSQPYTEINSVVRALAEALHLDTPPEFSAGTELGPLPRTEELGASPRFLPGAVLGLFPLSNQGLLRDLKAMAAGEELQGPVVRFLSPKPVAEPEPALATGPDRLVCAADPCQARAVLAARQSPVLVIHGPPGTGKSQTIANIIGDHLARGERVLMVCDKRTALDVVHHRLERLGLGGFCAVVHDPHRDQRALYLKIREQLETLTERQTDPQAEGRLAQADAEWSQLREHLLGCHQALSQPPEPGQPCFHELVGEWLGLEDMPELTLPEALAAEATLADYDAAKPSVQEVWQRAVEADYARNPWVEAAGMELAELLAQPVRQREQQLSALQREAVLLDRTLVEGLPALDDGDLPAQAALRVKLAELLEALEQRGLTEARTAWYARPFEALRQTLAQWRSVEPLLEAIGQAPLDFELAGTMAAQPPAAGAVNAQLAAMEGYVAVASKWHAFLSFGAKNAAKPVFAAYALAMTPANGQRLLSFLTGLKTRLLCQDFLTRGLGAPAPGGLLGDAELSGHVRNHAALLDTLKALREALPPSLEPLVAATIGQSLTPLAGLLRQSAARAVQLARFNDQLARASLFAPPWLQAQDQAWRRDGPPAADVIGGLHARLDTLETILRGREAFDRVPAGLQPAVARLREQGAEPAEGLTALRKALLGHAISQRIRAEPLLRQIDQQRMERSFGRYRELQAQRMGLAREALIHRWVALQKSRLLAATGTQLNAAGAALKRRLVTRGERALKLRAMVQQGIAAGEPDPLFDVCPVWMASPATVAQVFPRAPIFDLIVFDEASQCRLEEAVPVLTRGRRVVVAGDPKQLPPTRFFESALVETEVEEADTEQGFFEQQQAETEDLLGAALNLEAGQAYLDVHYRSTNAGLIGFSNRVFYQSRLQPIPGHPRNRPRECPIKLVRADGRYEKRGNQREAEVVVGIVAGLLAQPEPPSIGVACFNLTQRDLILDELDARAENDPVFAGRLEQARRRQGTASFEGLFVKNLENVQGDERDHMIISTTFGPDAAGKFRRNFGPVGRTGGGRRLNVLVTRAREQIHVVTSIPPGEYRALPPLAPDQVPGGRWLLYDYLNYAEHLERAQREDPPPAAAASAAPGERREESGGASALVRCLARDLAREHQLASDSPWGNPGFCVDIALRHPSHPGDVTLGVLCDMTRFATTDPVAWDVFRVAILEGQGWEFHRVWSPALFADSARHKRAIATAARRVLRQEKEPPAQAGDA